MYFELYVSMYLPTAHLANFFCQIQLMCLPKAQEMLKHKRATFSKTHQYLLFVIASRTYKVTQVVCVSLTYRSSTLTTHIVFLLCDSLLLA